MRALFTLILVLILIPIILIGGLAALLYFTYFDVQPAQYPFLHDVSQVQSIEYARFVFSDDGLTPEKVGIVLDTEGFMQDLKATDCHTGIEVNEFMDLINGQPIDGVVINYTDGSFDFITPYLCINSKYNPKVDAIFSELFSRFLIDKNVMKDTAKAMKFFTDSSYGTYTEDSDVAQIFNTYKKSDFVTIGGGINDWDETKEYFQTLEKIS